MSDLLLAVIVSVMVVLALLLSTVRRFVCERPPGTLECQGEVCTVRMQPLYIMPPRNQTFQL